MLSFCRRPKWSILPGELQLTTNPYNLLSGREAVQQLAWSSKWCKSHRTRNCLIPSPPDVKTYIRALQGKRLRIHLTDHSTLIQSSTYRKLSGSIYWSGLSYFNSVYNQKWKYSFRYFTKIFREDGGERWDHRKSKFLLNIWRIYQLQWLFFINKSHCCTESSETDLRDWF